MSSSNFTGNAAGSGVGGGIWWGSKNGNIISCIFSNNTARYGAGFRCNGDNCIVTDCIFTGNNATYGGGINWWYGANGTVTGCIFTDNYANTWGGGINWWYGANGTVIDSIFTENIANEYGGSIYWNIAGSMTNCSFVNSKSQQSNGIYTDNNLNINDGEGIVYITIKGTLSGTSIVVLNNETYYYPPNTNINLADKFKNKRSRQR